MKPAPRHPYEEVVAQLVRRHQAALTGFLEQRIEPALRSLVSAEDVLSLLWARALKRLEAGRPVEEVEQYLWHTAQECYLDLRKHHLAAKRNVRAEVAWPDDSAEQLALRLLASVTTPSAALRREEGAAALRRLLSRLPSQYRDLLLLHYLEGVPLKEAAARLMISVDNAYQLHCRALKRLRALWEREHPDSPSLP